MPRHVRDVLEDALHSGTSADFSKTSGTYRFDVEGEGSWLITVAEGAPSVTKGGGAADCILSCNREDFERIVTGRQNLLTAHMQGRLRIEGDPMMALRFINAINSASQPTR